MNSQYVAERQWDVNIVRIWMKKGSKLKNRELQNAECLHVSCLQCRFIQTFTSTPPPILHQPSSPLQLVALNFALLAFVCWLVIQTRLSLYLWALSPPVSLALILSVCLFCTPAFSVLSVVSISCLNFFLSVCLSCDVYLPRALNLSRFMLYCLKFCLLCDWCLVVIIVLPCLNHSCLATITSFNCLQVSFNSSLELLSLLLACSCQKSSIVVSLYYKPCSCQLSVVRSC